MPDQPNADQAGGMSPSEIGAFYDNVSWLYEIIMGDNRHIGYWTGDPDEDAAGTPEDRLTDFLIDRLGVTAGQSVLDVGCGVGLPAVRLAREHGVRVTGLTVSGTEVKTATGIAERDGVSDLVTFLEVDAMHPPVADRSVDAAWFVESLLYMPDRVACLREAHRTLVPGGRLVVSDYAERLALDDAQRDLLRQTFMVGSLADADGYAAMVAEAGFVDVAVHDLTDQLRRTCDESDRTLTEKSAAVEAKAGPEFATYFAEYTRAANALQRDRMGYTVVTARTP